VTLSFNCITNNLVGNCDIGENQLTVDVSDAGSNTVLFEFFNTGSERSTIAEIYFDNGSSLFEVASIDKAGKVPSQGVSFSVGATPPNLPGGNGISFSADFSMQADNPAPQWGVNLGESVGITFALASGQTFADVIDELTTGHLRMGLHVINFDDGFDDGSESFVNNPVPIPAAVWLFGSGLLGLVGIARRRR
jgi:hypothetical protein